MIPTEAIILAAGVGARLASRHGGVPKCLVPVAGVPILERQIHELRHCGIRRLVVVTGYRHDSVAEVALRAAGDVEVVFAHNPEYRETNVLTSWLLGSEWLSGDHYYLHGDTVFESRVLRALSSVRDPAAVHLTVDRHPCGEEEMKVISAGERIVTISKTVDPTVVLGEFTGVLRAPGESLPLIRALATELLERPDGRRQFFEAALQEGIDRDLIVVQWQDVTGLRWREVDFPEDLDAANELFGASPSRVAPDET